MQIKFKLTISIWCGICRVLLKLKSRRGCLDIDLVLHKICHFSSIMKVKGRTSFRNEF